MRFAIDVPNFGDFGDPRLLLDLAVETEAAGWDGFFLWDHLVPPAVETTTDPWVVISAIAASTERIRFGPMVTPLARRRMSKLARETVALDHLSAGRLIMGVGLGSQDDLEFGAFGDAADRRVRGRILDESLDVLAGLWSGQPFSYAGRYLLVEESEFRPSPLQQPRIPVWVAGLWPNRRPMRRAAAWDGAFPIDRGGDLTRQMAPDEMAEVLAFVTAERSSHAPIDLVHAGLMSGDRVGDAELTARYAEMGVTWWLEHVYPGRMSVDELRELIRRGPPGS